MIKYIFGFLIVFNFLGFSQNEDIQIGSSFVRAQSNGAYYDYSDPEAVNIKVDVWGFVKYPGKYVIPVYSKLTDLLSLAGGPTEDAHLEDLRILKAGENNNQDIFHYDYNELMWEEKIQSTIKNPSIQAGDILIIPGSPRFYFRDYLQVGLSILSAAISLTILFINVF